MTPDGYPDEHEWQTICDWSYRDLPGLMAYVRERWSPYGRWIEREEDGYRVYTLITGGWGGNEMLISALRETPMLWAVAWQRSERGGRHEFRLPVP